MYENLIQRTPISNKPNNLSVRLGTMPVNEKVAYVESVCAALIDARFGRRMGAFIIEIGELPEFEEAVLCKMSEEEIVPSYVVLPDSEMARRYAVDIVRREQAHSKVVNESISVQTFPPSNLGRGSPKISWDAIGVSIARVCP